MLALTKKVDYGLIALCHLAQNRDQVSNAREIAERYRLPQALLMNVLKIMSHKGLLTSSRGPKGGYELAVEPEQITLCDVVEAVEGPVRFVQCAGINNDGEGESQRCEMLDVCPISQPTRRLHDKLRSFLKQVSLSEIAFDPSFGRKAIGDGEMGSIAVTITARESE